MIKTPRDSQIRIPGNISSQTWPITLTCLPDCTAPGMLSLWIEGGAAQPFGEDQDGLPEWLFPIFLNSHDPELPFFCLDSNSDKSSFGP